MKRLALTLGLLMAATGAHAQSAPAPLHRVDRVLSTGRHSLPVSADPVRVVFSETVGEADAPWLQLHFGEFDLGANSILRLTALEDGDQQHFTQRTLTIWEGNSALFNGGLVMLELLVAPGDDGVFATLDALSVGERGAPEALCDGDDDRVSTTDPAVGRIVPIGCTGWIVSSGAYLTAGHCIAAGFTTIEFNVPSSDPDGTINNALVEDQYPILSGSIVFDNGSGQDWAVYDVGENTETGLTAIAAQGDFFRMTRDHNPAAIRITGYGTDDTPPGSTGGRNADNQTLQTDTGSNEGETVEAANNAYWEYRADTMGGNSGGPIITTSAGLPETTVGIHTTGGCEDDGGANTGTSFENDDLETAIRNFTGANAKFLDNGDAIPFEDGTVFRPYSTLSNAVNAVSTGGVVSIVQGTYTTGTSLYTKAMRWAAPVGSVVVH